jgi:hypothetical protein
VYRPTEEERVRALRDLRILDTASEERFDGVVRVAQRLFNVPAASINLIDRDRQWTKASIDLNAVDPLTSGGTCPRDDTVCAYTVAQDSTLVIDDLTTDDRFAHLPAVAPANGLRFYAGHPLHAPGGEAVGALCILDTEPHRITDNDLALLRDLALLVEHELAMSSQLNQAAAVQRQLLPKAPPTIPGYQIAGRCLPASEVGGDFYDWYTLDDGTPQITLADVMGKGLAAALIAASVRALLRGGSRHHTLDSAVSMSAHGLQGDLNETGRFVTLFAARLDAPTGNLTYVDAGHGLSLILDTDGGYRAMVSDGLPLGTLSDDQWAAHTAHLAPGETLMSVSDGFLDFYPDVQAALAAAVRATAATSTAEELVEKMMTFAAAQASTDDVTAIIIRRERT